MHYVWHVHAGEYGLSRNATHAYSTRGITGIRTSAFIPFLPCNGNTSHNLLCPAMGTRHTIALRFEWRLAVRAWEFVMLHECAERPCQCMYDVAVRSKGQRFHHFTQKTACGMQLRCKSYLHGRIESADSDAGLNPGIVCAGYSFSARTMKHGCLLAGLRIQRQLIITKSEWGHSIRRRTNCCGEHSSRAGPAEN